MSQKEGGIAGGVGRLSYKPSTDEGLIPKTLKFIRDQLPDWRDDAKLPSDDAEKSLNFHLCVFLNRRSREILPMVHFQHEVPQGKSRSVDMGVLGTEELTVIDARGYSIYEPFLVIEAKRLPAPSRDREREYVAGEKRNNASPTGGVQRFKLGLHGADIEIAVMIGYIQEKTIPYWHAVINQWIGILSKEKAGDKCIWGTDDMIGKYDLDEERGISSSVSDHLRAESCRTKSIRIHHLWVEMEKKRGSQQT